MQNEESARRDQILQQTSAYILENGVADLSLRPLAAALNTSPRMLLYYFASKEQLVAESLEFIRRGHEQPLLDLPKEKITLRAYWEWSAGEGNRRYLRLLYEVFGVSVRNPPVAGHFLRRPTFAWRDPLERRLQARGLPGDAVAAISDYVAATVAGLEITLIGSGDLDRANTAFAILEDQVAQVLEG